MDHETFVNRMTGPLYVWRMGRGVAYPHGPQEEARTPLQRSGRTRMANAQRAMDDLVLARAEAIQAERAVDTEVLEADDTVPVERLAHWLHSEFKISHRAWAEVSEPVQSAFRRSARALMSQLPELFRREDLVDTGPADIRTERITITNPANAEAVWTAEAVDRDVSGFVGDIAHELTYHLVEDTNVTRAEITVRWQGEY